MEKVNPCHKCRNFLRILSLLLRKEEKYKNMFTTIFLSAFLFAYFLNFLYNHILIHNYILS